MIVLALAILRISQDPGPEGAQDPRSSTSRAIQEALQARDYVRLEALAHEAIQKDQKEALGWFHLGYARAARGGFHEAVGAYCEAVRLGLNDPKVHYQLGYAAHRSGQHAIARAALQDCLAVQPQNADALYYLGVTQLELAELAGAESTLTRLLSRSTRWDELAHFHRGLVRAKAGRRQDAAEDFRWVVRSGQDEGLRKRSEELIGPEESTPARPPAKAAAPVPPWTLVWHEKAGYDSNVLRLPSTSLSAETDEDDLFLMTFLSGSVAAAAEGLLTLRLSLLDLSYADLDESSLDGVLFAADHESPLGDGWTFTAAGTMDAFWLDRESFFRQAGLRAGLRGEPGETFRLRGGLSFQFRDFEADEVETLDGREAGLFAEVELRRLPEGLAHASFRYEAADVTAETDEDAYVQHRVRLALEAVVHGPLSARAEGRLSRRDFRSEDAAFGETRHDLLLGARFAALYSATKSVQLMLEVELERNSSSIDAFDYDRTSIAAGLTWVF